MPEIYITPVELTCLNGEACLEPMEGPCLESITDGNPEISANTGNRLMSAMVLNRMDSEERHPGSSLKG